MAWLQDAIVQTANTLNLNKNLMSQKEHRAYDPTTNTMSHWKGMGLREGIPHFVNFDTPIMDEVGQKDKKGKKVFEEDIILLFGKYIKVAHLHSFCVTPVEPKDIEILGNILQNSELLHKKK